MGLTVNVKRLLSRKIIAPRNGVKSAISLRILNELMCWNFSFNFAKFY